MKLYPHLNFGGNWEEALRLSEKLLCGRITMMMKKAAESAYVCLAVDSDDEADRTYTALAEVGTYPTEYLSRLPALARARTAMALTPAGESAIAT
jgi:hypothetical protein